VQTVLPVNTPTQLVEDDLGYDEFVLGKALVSERASIAPA